MAAKTFFLNAAYLAAAAMQLGSVKPTELKGYDTVLFYGGPLNTIVRVGDPTEAAAFYKVLVDALHTGSDYPYLQLKGRTCIGIAVFRHRLDSVPFPVNDLHPGSADLTYWFYPQVGNAPAVIGGKILRADLTAKLEAYGVSTIARTEQTTRCQWGP